MSSTFGKTRLPRLLVLAAEGPGCSSPPGPHPTVCEVPGGVEA
ncbi:hypothetical protein [Amycolatopsis alkalitolerans]|nr:hypothetical protein [Amycolatopsis alkalitolerans]